MKRLALPLIAAAPFLSALAPHAEAAAIASHRPSLSPLRLGTAPVKRRFNYGVAPAPVQSNRPAPAARPAESLDSILGGTVQAASAATLDLGVVKTGGGTLSFEGSRVFVSAGTVIMSAGSSSAGLDGSSLTLGGGSLFLSDPNTRLLGGTGSVVINLATSGVEQTLSNLSITMGGTIDISSLVVAPPDRGTVLVNGDGTGALTKTGVGVLTITDTSTFVGDDSLLTNGVITLGNTGSLLGGDPTLTTLPVAEFNSGFGTISVGASGVVTHGGSISGGTVTVRQADGSFLLLNGSGNPHLVVTNGQTLGVEPSAAPVPEPGAATLFALGMLAASQGRRRKV